MERSRDARRFVVLPAVCRAVPPARTVAVSGTAGAPHASSRAALLVMWAALALQVFLGCSAFGDETSSAGRSREVFDFGWRFHAGELRGAERPSFDDAGWQAIDLPHDFAITGQGSAPFGGLLKEGPFDRASPAGSGGGYLDAGVGWYRKSFVVAPSERGRRLFIEFDGVYMDSTVWLNGHRLGNRPYGYSSFEYELTPYIAYGARNTLAVRVEVPQPSSRWYSGAGIYRHVWLAATDPVHIAHWGTYVTTPSVQRDRALVHVSTSIVNEESRGETVRLVTTITDANGRVVAQGAPLELRVRPGETSVFDESIPVNDPHVWSTEDPYLYEADSSVAVGSVQRDRYATRFGIRTIEFTADNGFLLNGRRVAIQGVCLHHDQGPLGAAAFDRAIERQLETLKAMGANAIRTSHDPPAPALLDLADRMGFLVMDEAFDEWRTNKTRFGYGRFFDAWADRDLHDMIVRDRNHPSVILWSIGNEIPEQRRAGGAVIAAHLAAIVHSMDPTRPATSALNEPDDALATGFTKSLDVLGINYNLDAYARFHGIAPIVASETSSDLSSRDEYNLEPSGEGVTIRSEDHHQVTSYDLDAPRWGNRAEDEFRALRAAPWVAGEFVWTGFDYLGEPTPFEWPSRSSYFGIIDLAGFPKDRFYLYQSEWQTKPVVHLLPYWDWPGFEGKNIPVWCYTNADAVELFLNGRSLGVRMRAATSDLHLEWLVPYEPGTLTAVARTRGSVVATESIVTPSSPARVELSVDRGTIRADGEDLAYVTARVVDANGNWCPRSDAELTFSLSGGGTVAGVGNGDPTNHESFQGERHRAFHGLAIAIIRAPRNASVMTLTASAEGLAPATVTIGAVP